MMRAAVATAASARGDGAGRRRIAAHDLNMFTHTS